MPTSWVAGSHTVTTGSVGLTGGKAEKAEAEGLGLLVSPQFCILSAQGNIAPFHLLESGSNDYSEVI